MKGQLWFENQNDWSQEAIIYKSNIYSTTEV